MEELKGKITDYMSAPVLKIESSATVQEAAQYMQGHPCGALLVTKNQDYVGFLSEADLTHHVAGKGLDPKATRVAEVVTEPLLSIEGQRPIEEAGEFMCKNKVRHVAVTEGQEVVGILCVKDLFDYCAKTFHMVN